MWVGSFLCIHSVYSNYSNWNRQNCIRFLLLLTNYYQLKNNTHSWFQFLWIRSLDTADSFLKSLTVQNQDFSRAAFLSEGSRKNLFPGSFRLLVEYSSIWLWDTDCFLADMQGLFSASRGHPCSLAHSLALVSSKPATATTSFLPFDFLLPPLLPRLSDSFFCF